MKIPSSHNITQALIVLGVFAVSTFVTYGASTTGSGLLKSTPYTLRSTTADTTLNNLTNGAGAAILDGVVVSVKAKATAKAGTPFNTGAYNAYIDSRLALLDNLDDQVRLELGSDYAFLFQYIYPRILELKKSDADINSILDRITTEIDSSGTGSSIGDILDDLLDNSTGSVVSTGTTSTGTTTGTTTGTGDSIGDLLDGLLN